MIRNDTRPKLRQVHLAATWLLVITWIMCFAGVAFTQGEATLGLTSEEMVTRLMSAVSQGSEENIEELVMALQGLGEAAIPAIANGLSQGDDLQRVQLVRALGGIAGDSATSLLIEAVARGSSPKAAIRALFALENRTVRRALILGEVEALTGLVLQDNILIAGRASRVIAKCIEVPVADRLVPIIARFRNELASPSAIGKILGSYLSPRVYVRNQFLVAFSGVGESGIPLIAQERLASSGNSDIEKWWVLALGFAGDKSVAQEIKDMVMAESDRYFRCVAIRAYARSAKQDAVPLLDLLLADATESEYESCHGEKVLLIRDTAKDELAKLRGEVASRQ